MEDTRITPIWRHPKFRVRCVSCRTSLEIPRDYDKPNFTLDNIYCHTCGEEKERHASTNA